MTAGLRDDDVPVALTFAVFAGIAACMPAQSDTWTLLRSGQEIWHERAVFAAERFSHTAAGLPLYNHEWLSELVFFGLLRAGGPLPLTLVCAACAVGALYGGYRLMRGGSDVRVALMLVLAIGTTPEWAVRPQVLSLALFAVSLHIALRQRTVWLVPLCWVWSNVHGMVLFGIVVAACCALEALIWSRDRLSTDLPVFGACVVVPMLTPIGWHYWLRVNDTVAASRSLGIAEYRSAWQAGQWLFWIVLCAVVLVAAIRRHAWLDRRPSRILVLVSAVLAVAAALSTRNIAFFLLVAMPACSHLLAGETERTSRPAGPLGWGLVSAGALASLLFAAVQWRDGGRLRGWQPLSVAAGEAIANCRGRLFNGFADGGPIMWFVPGRPIFIDGRVEAYPPDLFLRTRRAELDGEYRQLFRDYDIGCAAVQRGSTIDRLLQQDAGVVRTFGDSRWSVFRVTADRKL